MYIVVGGLNHRTTPLNIREKAALSGASLEKAYRELKSDPNLEGVVILTTCNRTEIYATAREPQAASTSLVNYLTSLLELGPQEAAAYLYNPTCFAAIEHLFKVASGLDSMVLGETQILGQVRDAWQKSMALGASDVVLNTLFQKALHTGKKVRYETGLDRNAVSISYAAVELARQQLGSLKDRRVIVIGAGEMGQLAAYYLAENGAAGVLVSNRSLDRATEVAQKIGGRAIRLDELPSCATEADILISCTSASHYVLRYQMVEDIMRARAHRDLVLIDIAVPRDIDPEVKKIPGVHLFDVDDLHCTVEQNLLERRKAAREADAIIAKELQEFEHWLSCLYVTPVISALRQKADMIRDREVERTLRRLGEVSDREARLIHNLATSITNQLLKEPINTLKDMAVTENGHLYAEVAGRLFNLQSINEETEYAQADHWD